MQKKITEITASSGFGIPPGRKLLKVNSGKYGGRLMAVIKTTNNEIKYSYADHPYNLWSSLISIASDVHNAPIDAVMDESGNVYVVYIEQTTEYLVSKKISFNDGAWTVGSKVYVLNTSTCYVPNITIDNNNLWISFGYLNTGLMDIQVKSSTDNGVTWGSGPTDVGDNIAPGLISGIPKISTSANTIFVVYVSDWTDIKLRTRALSGGSWSSEFTIVSSLNIDEHFDITVLPEGSLSLVYDDDQLNYREYDGVNWGPVTVIDTNSGSFPQLKVINNVPVIIYLSEFGSGQYSVKYSSRIDGSFSTPIEIDNRSVNFDSVILYDLTSNQYADLTSASSDDTSADVFHPQSSVLCSNVGDTIYLGMDQQFRFVNVILSTVGIGGTVGYSYWDGINWNSFNPAGGNYNLTQSNKGLILWDDFDSIPVNWQKNKVYELTRFWVKIEVQSGFSTSPVGTQLSSISNLTAINVRR
jgi:hypothetical protein